jgi:hypothetical protein
MDPSVPTDEPCNQNLENANQTEKMYITGLLLLVQFLAAIYLCKLTKNGQALTVLTATRAARVCNAMSFGLMVAVGYFIWGSVYGCYDTPMYAISLIFVDFMWVSRAVRYSRYARYLRIHRSISGALLARDLNAPDILDDGDQPVAVAAVFAQPVDTPSSHDSEAPLVRVAKTVTIWESDVEV